MKTNLGLTMRLVQRSFACIVVAMIASPVVAQTPAPAPAPRPGDVDLANSRVYILVSATGLGHPHGVEGRLASGNLQLGAAQNAGQLVIDMKSFAAETPAARKYVGLAGESDDSTRRQVTDNMLGPEVLDVARFPQSTFAIQSASRYVNSQQQGGPPLYILDGQFTLHGVAKHLRLLAQGDEVNGMIHVHGRFDFLQSQFGITPFTKLLGTVGVADKLYVYGDLWVYAR